MFIRFQIDIFLDNVISFIFLFYFSFLVPQVQHNMLARSNVEDEQAVKALSWVLKEKDSER